MDLAPPAASETSLAAPLDISASLRSGFLVITANQRAARSLRRQHDAQQQAAGSRIWAPPSVLAWESWTRSLWHQLVLTGHATSLLLTRAQELALWREVISTDFPLQTLRQPEALAVLAAEAWATLHAHRHSGPLTGPAESTDEAAFRRWSASFRSRCRRDAFVTAAELEATLERAVGVGDVRLSSPTLLLVGFDQRTPAQQALLDAFTRRGTVVNESCPAMPASHLLCSAGDTPQAELEGCAAWTREQLARCPTARIGIVVPDLGANRAELERILRDVLCPELHNIELRDPQLPFEFSLGVPLSSTASVVAAIDLLTWSQQPLPSSTVRCLLLSRYLAGQSFAAERLPRAVFDTARSRALLLRPERTLDDLLRQLASANSATPGLRTSLRAFSVAAKPLQDGSNRTHLEWSEHIRRALDAAGWIPVAESSLEYQVRQRWEALLDELASLDFTGQRVSFLQVLASLKRMAGETIFAPEAQDAPVQVLGPLEAAGSTFDALWVLRCGDLNFPVPASSNPLLPLRLRRFFRLPGSHTAEDAARAQRLLRRLVSSAPLAVMSYARHHEQSSQQLTAAARELHPVPLDPASVSAVPRLPSVQLLPVPEDTIPPPPDRVLSGGAALLADQAACGFRAFAQHRLGSKPLEEVAFGIDPRARGEIVHQILEKFWAEVRTQSALRELTPASRRARLEEHITHALTTWQTADAASWDRAYLDVQRSCLASVLDEWLVEELRREPFEVHYREQSHEQLAVGPLRLRIRVDRIDYTESGGAVLIDYKTGVSKPRQWLTDRPDAPQLPLYTLLPEVQQLDAVSFGIVRTGRDLGFSGYEARPGVIPGATRLLTTSLADLQQQWRETLEQLSSDFHAGDTRVRPKNFPTTCTYCAQRLLCRMDANALAEDLAAQDDTDEDAERG